jgi:long-chain acyl-CoA synthetase
VTSLTEHARTRPGKPAIVMAGSGAGLTFAELDAAARHLAAELTARGLRRGDVVAICMENCPELIAASLAAQRSGLYFVPVNWHLTSAEAGYMLADSGARVLLTTPGMAGLAAAASRQAAVPPDGLVVIGGEGPGSVRLHTASPPPLPPREPCGIYMFYSSGTTGRPKGVLPGLPGTPFGDGLPLEQTMAGHYGFGTDTRYLSTGPLYHAAPLGWSLGTIALGGTTVLMERFDAEEALRAVERHRITHAQFVPTMFTRMLKLPWPRHSWDTSSLRVVVHAAAPCPVEVKQAMIDWLGPIVYEYYAASEGICFFAISPGEWLKRQGSVGRPLQGVPHVLGEDGAELPPGETGQLWIEVKADVRYHNDPAKTAAMVNDHGWYTIGDMGRLDEDGYLYLADRRTDLIISGGVNIYPREIEDALVMHPAVLDVAVIGVPDEEMGQRALAVVQPTPGVSAGPELTQALLEHLSGRIARFKLPRAVEFAAELPRTPSGKVLRRVVRDRYAGR